MAVRYKLTKINDNITDNKTVKYSVTTVSYDNVNLDALAEQIAGSSTCLLYTSPSPRDTR